MMMSPWLLSLVYILSHVQCVSGRCTFEHSADSTPNFDDYIEAVIKQLHVPGISLAIVDLKQNASSQIFAKGYGFAKLPNTPATADTLYYTGSTTKAFTAAVAAKLIHNNTVLDWDTRLHDVLPNFVLEHDHATKHTTVEDALSHRSGLASHVFSYRTGSPSAVTKSLRWLPLTSEPRARWQYSNLMYAVIGNLLETISGAPLGRLMKTYLWEPLGMQSTFFSLADATATDEGKTAMSAAYYWVDCKDETFGPNPSCGPDDEGYYVPEQYLDLSGTSAAGSIISSVNDYALWMRSVLQSDVSWCWSNKTSPFADIATSVVRPRSIIPIELLGGIPENIVNPPNYALGWITSIFRGRNAISHSGGVPGYITEVTILPNEGLGIVTLANAAGEGAIAGQLILLDVLRNKLNLSAIENQQYLTRVHDTGSLLGSENLNLNLGIPHHNKILKQDQSLPGPLPWNPQKKAERHYLPANYNQNSIEKYTHPAYGSLTVTQHVLSQPRCGCRVDLPEVQECRMKVQRHLPQYTERFLIVEPSAHTLDFALYLQLSQQEASQNGTGTIFDGMLIQLHGDCREKFNRRVRSSPVMPIPSCNNATNCRDECAGSGLWQESIGYFEPAGDSYAARLGLVLEPEMVRYAEEKGRRARNVGVDRYGEASEELREVEDQILKESMVWFDHVEERRYVSSEFTELWDLLLEMEEDE